jgi:hypothetical protein
VLLMAPRQVAESVCDYPPGAALGAVIRVLGAREVVLAAVTYTRRGRRALLAGGAVDAIHCASMILLAVREPQFRRLAVASAAVSVVLASATVHDARRAPR